MRGSTYDAAFGVETLSTMVRTFDTEAHDTFFSKLFRRTNITADGDSVSWDEVRMERDLAPVTSFDSPAPRTKNIDRIRRDAHLASIKLYTDISGHKLYKERGAGRLHPAAEETIANEVHNMRLKIQKTINYMSVNLLLGSLDMNPVNIPGTEITVPTIRTGVATYTRAKSWADKTTPILSEELEEIVAGKDGYVANAGRLPGLAVINQTVEGCLIKNDEVREWLKTTFGGSVGFSSPAARTVMNGVNIGGLKWLKNVHGYVPTNKNVFTMFLPDGVVILLPPEEELGEVLSMAEGHGLIPKNAIGSQDVHGVIDLAPQPGFYSYATALENPPGVRVFVGWLGLPVIKFPKAVCVARVV